MECNGLASQNSLTKLHEAGQSKQSPSPLPITLLVSAHMIQRSQLIMAPLSTTIAPPSHPSQQYWLVIKRSVHPSSSDTPASTRRALCTRGLWVLSVISSTKDLFAVFHAPRPWPFTLLRLALNFLRFECMRDCKHHCPTHPSLTTTT